MRDYLSLAKPGVTALVVVTAAIGWRLAGGGVGLPFAAVLAGVALAAGGTSALNMVWERDADARMRRTRGRPLPTGRIGVAAATVFGLLASIAGPILLATTHPLAAALCVASTLSYVLLYTPLKKRSWLSLPVGAVSGALPPVIGWAAARGALDPTAWLLFAVLFLWQMPHFVSIAWLYRDDYAAGGFRVVSAGDTTGARTARHAVAWTTALVILTLVPAGWGYRAAALAIGAAFLACALRFATRRTPAAARALLLGSIAYLPAQLALMALTR